MEIHLQNDMVVVRGYYPGTCCVMQAIQVTILKSKNTKRKRGRKEVMARRGMKELKNQRNERGTVREKEVHCTRTVAKKNTESMTDLSKR